MSKSTANEHIADKGNAYAAGDHRKRSDRPGCCKRFWWLWLIVVVVVVLIVVLPIVFVGFPNMAQSQVNKSTLEVKSQVVSDPKPDSVNLAISSTAKSSSSFHPTLDEFTANLYLIGHQDKPFGQLTFPSTKVEPETNVDISQTMKVLDMDQFKEYNKVVIGSEEFTFGVSGKTGLTQSGLPKMHVDYTKTITMKGLNKLQGFKIEDFNITLTKFDDGSNLQGTVFIPNPSVLTISLGTVSLNLAVDDTPLGYSLIPDMTLKPGDNRFKMSSFTDQSAVLKLLTKHTDGILPITITGNSSVNAAGEHLPYFEAAMKDNVMMTQMNIGEKVSGLLGGGS